MNKQTKKPKLIKWFKEGARLNIAMHTGKSDKAIF